MHPARRNRDLPTNDRKDERGCKSFRRNGTVATALGRRVLRAPRPAFKRLRRGKRSSPQDESVRWRTRRLHCKIDNSSGEMPKQTHTSRSPASGVKLCDAHHSIDHSDSVIDRSVPGVAVQLRLGLLSERRNWNYPLDRTDSGPNRTHLIRSLLCCRHDAAPALSEAECVAVFSERGGDNALQSVATALRSDRSF